LKASNNFSGQLQKPLKRIFPVIAGGKEDCYKYSRFTADHRLSGDFKKFREFSVI